MSRLSWTPIAEVREGRAAVVGGCIHCPPEALLSAPFSERLAVCYRVRVQRLSRRFPRPTIDWHWVDFVEELRAAPFAVADASGKALVTEPIKVDLARDHRIDGEISDLSSPVAKRLDVLLERHGLGRMTHGENYRFREEILVSDATVEVAGDAEWGADPAPAASASSSYRETPLCLFLTRATVREVVIPSHP